MRLLVFTQKVDINDSILGFFHTWLLEMAKKAESIEVVCLMKGDYSLPSNVSVYSLGKEDGSSRFKYLKNLFHYLFLIRDSYDNVFVHMNQEYVLLVGLYWRLKRIPIYLWRNHPKGSFITRIAVMFSTKVFCTSVGSFTARFKKTVIMPVGIDTNTFRPIETIVRKKYSVCVVGRIASIKHIELALYAINTIISSGSQISLTIVGSPLEADLNYYGMLKKYVSEHDLLMYVNFVNEVSPGKVSEIYNSHEVCLNLTESGSFDKTIVEAAACEAIPVVSNESLSHLLPEACITGNKPETIANSLKRVLDAHERMELQKELKSFVESQSLETLMEKLFIEMQ